MRRRLALIALLGVCAYLGMRTLRDHVLHQDGCIAACGYAGAQSCY